MEERDIREVLEALEGGYDIINNNLFKEQVDFLAMGKETLDLNVLPHIDIPVTLKEYLIQLKEK